MVTLQMESNTFLHSQEVYLSTELHQRSQTLRQGIQWILCNTGKNAIDKSKELAVEHDYSLDKNGFAPQTYLSKEQFSFSNWNASKLKKLSSWCQVTKYGVLIKSQSAWSRIVYHQELLCIHQ